jgi:aryl-alcohol dehydrogenase-like predicted oxidoreductase
MRRSGRRLARSTPPFGRGRLYAGISSYSAVKTREAAAILRSLGTTLLIHQPSYSMLNRWIEPELLDTLEQEGVGCIVFSPLAQGMLTEKYLDGVPEGSRASWENSLSSELLTDEALGKIRGLNEIAGRRGQSLAQNGARLDATRPTRDFDAGRREQREPAGGQRRRAREPRAHG